MGVDGLSGWVPRTGWEGLDGEGYSTFAVDRCVPPLCNVALTFIGQRRGSDRLDGKKKDRRTAMAGNLKGYLVGSPDAPLAPS